MQNNKYRNQYEIELLKQQNPYSYYVKYIEQEIKGERETPFICIEENENYRVYDGGQYFIYEAKKGTSNDAEKGLLVEYAEKLNADLIYTDSDFVNSEGIRYAPFFKPDWSPDFYDSYDYISEFYAVKKELNNTCINKITGIKHISKVLFHNVCNKNDDEIYNDIYLNSKTPDYVSNVKIDTDTVSIVIPSKDNPDMLRTCLEGIRRAKIKSSININETVIVDNGSNDKNHTVIEGLKELFPELNIKYLFEKEDFNFSHMCNKGANQTTGEYILFLNDDIETVDELFIIKLLYYARMDRAGAVGAKLIYPGGDIIQHTGITDMKYCGPSHKLSTFSDSKNHYFARNKINLNCLAVTGACLMVNRQKYFLIGGFHDKMKVGYNDVDLCISLYEKGYHNVVVNDTCLIHHESVSRGNDISKEKHLRLKEERALLYERHPFVRDFGDPYYNSNLAGDFLDYRVNVIPEFENREYRSIRRKDLEKKAYSLFVKNGSDSSKNCFFNLESVDFVRELFEEGNAVTLSGWGLINKKDNSLFDRFLCVFDKNEQKAYVFEVAPKYRTDVKDVFPQAKNPLLSGYTAKISIEEYNEEKDYEYGMLFISKHFGIKYYAGLKKSDI